MPRLHGRRRNAVGSGPGERPGGRERPGGLRHLRVSRRAEETAALPAHAPAHGPRDQQAQIRLQGRGDNGSDRLLRHAVERRHGHHAADRRHQCRRFDRHRKTVRGLLLPRQQLSGRAFRLPPHGRKPRQRPLRPRRKQRRLGADSQTRHQQRQLFVRHFPPLLCGARSERAFRSVRRVRTLAGDRLLEVLLPAEHVERRDENHVQRQYAGEIGV